VKSPVLSPHEKKRVLVDSYLGSYRRAGLRPDPVAVEKLVIADCELVDAAERNGELRGGGAPKDPGPPGERRDVIAEAEQETGVRRVDPNVGPRWRPVLLHQRPNRVDERWAFACGRIARILKEGTQGGAPGKRYVGNCGALAKEYHTAYACLLTRNLPATARGFKINPFDGLPERDCQRVYRRIVEDICDRSTGVLGSWFTK
jgi:hypothetical protein